MEKNDQLLDFYFPPEKKFRKHLLTGIRNLLLFLFLILSFSYHNPDYEQHKQQLSKLIDFKIQTIYDSDSVNLIDHQINKLLIDFYKTRDFQPIWINHLTTTSKFSTLYNLLDSSKYFGFPFDYFNFKDIKDLNQKLIQKTNTHNLYNDLADLELKATFSAFKLLIYLKHGIVKTDTSGLNHEFINTLPVFLTHAMENKKLRQHILSVQPKMVQYQKIHQSLSYFIDMNLSIKYTTPSFIDDQVLAKSLFYAGITESPKFSTTNTKASSLYKLQDNYKLNHDSILNTPTHQVLVHLLEQKYYQACLNLNRLRSLNPSGSSYLFVNIPEFKLHVIESNEIKKVFNVIVGKKQTPTPSFSSSLDKVVANPYWTVPKSIVNNEMIYKIRKDSNYLARNGFFVINNYEERVDDSIINWNQPDPLGNKYWLRQKNSSHNALGQVKFLFPNEHSVYLHDTPSKSLFKNQNRTYSHGCIRLENPEHLAQYLIDLNFFDEKPDFQQLIKIKEHHIIDLPKTINIHIQYITCSVNSSSELEFYNDVYDRDQTEISQIFPDQIEI